uniref:Phosphatidate cytidylyltransferase n=1 Tax=Ananas comosus var. bracteatus TaxID=296719 RepID=A0A6V7PGT6_ANACO|nr:unnamed protein product [Ananas comosus var. bracteatus]
MMMAYSVPALHQNQQMAVLKIVIVGCCSLLVDLVANVAVTVPIDPGLSMASNSLICDTEQWNDLKQPGQPVDENTFPWKEVAIMPVQWHALALGLFASIIAPFGGFFASGFKRAFKVKDFGDIIPGHGGITDRMDCQMVMAVFAYTYYQSFVMSQNFSVEMILEQIISA